MKVLIKFVKEPFARKLKSLARTIIKGNAQSVKLAAEEAFGILGYLKQSTPCESEQQIFIKLIATFYGAAHPKRCSFELDLMKALLDID
jgi:hypothetical protein